MPRYAAFLRGINVGGNKKVAMADLKACFEQAGCDHVLTLLQSGNVVFDHSERDSLRLEQTLEETCRTALGLTTQICVRNRAEMEDVVRNNPFRAEAEQRPSHLLIVFLKSAPLVEDIAALSAAIHGPEKLAVHGANCYVDYPEGIGTSKVDRTPGWKKLVGSGTGRNWNTVAKVLAAFD